MYPCVKVLHKQNKPKQDAEDIQNMSGAYLVVLNFIKWKQLWFFWDGGAPLPHTPQAGAALQTLRFYNGIECLMGYQASIKN